MSDSSVMVWLPLRRMPMREDDSLFALSHMMEKGINGPKSIKQRRGPYKSRQQELVRQRAEEAAANVMRHRIQENERRYPEIFATVRSPDFLRWYEERAGQPW